MGYQPEIKALLHDWDDTVVETHRDIFGLQLAYAQTAGLKPPTFDQLKAAWGMPLRDFLVALHGGEGEILEREYRASVGEDFAVKPFPWAAEAIDRLTKLGLVLGAVSSGPKDGIKKTLTKYPFLPADSHLFIHSAEDCRVHKPKAGVFDEAFHELRLLDIDERDSCFVGDSPSDLLASRARGLHFVAVLTGFTSREEFLEMGVAETDILPSLNYLPDYLEDKL